MLLTVALSAASAATLSVKIIGSGSGSINSNPSGIACASGNTGTCSVPFLQTPNVSLMATVGAYSIFDGWSGDCIGKGSCLLTMNADRSVTASFNQLPIMVKLGAALFGSLHSAYFAANEGNTILAMEREYNEGLFLDRGIDIILRGGYDSSFNSNKGRYTTINGRLVVSSGSLVVENLIIKGITVPNVVGMALANAESIIEDAGLMVGAITTLHNALIPAGTIISQNPGAGSSVSVDDSVNLVMSLGPATVVVPNVVGKTQTYAEDSLIAAGLSLGSVMTASSDTIPIGSVISHYPVAGTLVSLGSSVNLVISTGPVTVTVPNVVGQKQFDAVAMLNAANLSIVTISLSPSVTVEAGNVISQDPVANTVVPLVTAINLVVSSGPPPEITGITPASGKPGDTITLGGANFDPDISKNNVHFAGTLNSAQVVAASTQSLMVIVPESALSGPLTLTTTSGTATSTQSFSVDKTMNLSPAISTLVVGNSINFSCRISGLDQREIAWTLNGSAPNPAYGAITTIGQYTAPATVPEPPEVTLRCSSTVDPTLYREITFTLSAPLAVNDGGAVVSPAKGATVETPYGFATLDIPPLTIPEEIQITVASVNPALLPETPNTINLAAVTFSPSGLLFNKPVWVTFTLPAYEPPGTLLPLYYQDEANMNYVTTGQNAVVNASGMKAETWITHFSTYMVRKAVTVEYKELLGKQFAQVEPLFPEFYLEPTTAIPLLEGLSVPVVVKRRGGPGFGYGPFTHQLVVPVLSGYDRKSTPITVGPVRQASHDGWELGTIINIPTLRNCGEGETKSATLELSNWNPVTSSYVTMNVPFTIECLNELEISGDPYLVPNPLPSDTTLFEEPNGNLVLRLEPYAPNTKVYRFSEVTIGKKAILYNGLWRPNDTTSNHLEIEVTGNMTVFGEIRTMGGTGENGKDGSGADNGGAGGNPGCWHGAAGGRGAPYLVGFTENQFPIVSNEGEDGMMGTGGCGGAGGKPWEKGSWYGFVFDLAATVYNAGTFVASGGTALVSLYEAIQSAYSARNEAVKLFNNADNDYNSAGRGGYSGLFDDPYFLTGKNYPPAPGGGGGGGSGKMMIRGQPDAAGGGGGGGGGGAPTLRMFINGRLVLHPGGIINGQGGKGGRGGTGAGSWWDNQAAPGGGGAGGNGAKIQIMARRGIVNNGLITGQGGLGGLSGELNGDGEVVLIQTGIGMNGSDGVLRIDAQIAGNAPVRFSKIFNGPTLGAPDVASATNYCYELSFNDAVGYSGGSPRKFSSVVNGASVGNSTIDQQPVCFTLSEGLNLLSVKIGDSTTIDPDHHIGLHPWQYQPVFNYTATPADGDNDGLWDRDEIQLGTNMESPDSDGDGITDGDEVHKYHTNPLKGDTDGDGFSDGYEIAAGTNPLDPNSHPMPPQIAAGESYTMALKVDGTVWTWGFNGFGGLGDGTTIKRLTPVQVTGLVGVTTIAAGQYHTVALKSDGTVWAWGYNDSGQLGDGTTTNQLTPVQVTGLAGVIAVAAGQYHTVALKGDGTVWAWGRNEYGQLGVGTTTNCLTPVPVTGLSGVTAIAAGGYHTVVLKGNGTVWAWGANQYGQLGDGTTTEQHAPVPVPSLAGVTSIVAGEGHSVALKNDGAVWTWGHNDSGQLGDGTATDRLTPAPVSGLVGVTAIAAGGGHSVILKSDRTIWAWGWNLYGQLGDGTTMNRLAPVPVTSLTEVTTIAAGYYHTVAQKSDGMVWTWGWNLFGQLGDGTTSSRTVPVQVSGMAWVTAIAAGAYHSTALKVSGTVRTWGSNTFGQLGDGTTTDRLTPVPVTELAEVTAIATGSDHTLALKSDGTVWTWGFNGYGQLGDGTTTKRLTPVPVTGLAGVTAIAAGSDHTVILKGDGTVWAWGNNNSGQLGDGTTTNRLTPVPVTGLAGVTAIAAGKYHTVALKGDGTVWAWGLNSNGQLGDGTTTRRLTPVPVTGLAGVITIAAGGYHTVVLKGNGTVWVWGANQYGQMGDGTTTERHVPVPVTGLAVVTTIAAGSWHSAALKGDGTVWTWGSNTFCQLGDGSTTDRLNPVLVTSLTKVSALAGGYYHTMALKSDGTVWTWGDNSRGQLGDGTITNKNIPVPVKGFSVK